MEGLGLGYKEEDMVNGFPLLVLLHMEREHKGWIFNKEAPSYQEMMENLIKSLLELSRALLMMKYSTLLTS